MNTIAATPKNDMIYSQTTLALALFALLRTNEFPASTWSLSLSLSVLEMESILATNPVRLLMLKENLSRCPEEFIP